MINQLEWLSGTEVISWIFYTPNGGYKDFQVISNISDGGAKKVMNMWAKDIKNN